MAVNRYTKFLPQQYVSNYVPLPLNEIMQVGAQKQAQQDAYQAELAKLDAGIKQIHALPKDQEYAQGEIGKIHTDIDQYVNMDFNDPTTRSNWNKTKAQIVQRFSPTGDLGMIDTNYNLYNQWNKEFLQSGQKSGWGSDQLQRHSYNLRDSFQTIDPNTGTYNMFSGKGVANRVDYNEWISKSLKDVAADTKSLGLSKTYSGDELYDAWMQGTLETKDAQKIMNALALRGQGDPMLIQSLEQEGNFAGVSGMGKFVQGVDKNGNISIDTSNPFGAMLYGAAYGAAYRKIDPRYDIRENSVYAHAAKKKVDEVEPTPVNTLSGNLQSIKSLSLDKNKINVPFTVAHSNLTEQIIPFSDPRTNWKTTFTPEQERIYSQATKAYGDIAVNDAEKAEMINKYIDDFGQQNINVVYNQYNDPKQIQARNQSLGFGTTKEKNAFNANNRSFTLISGDGPQIGSGGDIYDKYGNTKDYTISVSGELTPDNPYYSAGEVVTIKKTNGEVVATYAMSGDNKSQADNSYIHNIYQIKYDPAGQKIIERDGQKYQLTYDDYKESYANGANAVSGDTQRPLFTNESRLTIVPLDSNGNPVKGQSMTYTSDKTKDQYNPIDKFLYHPELSDDNTNQ